MNTETPSPPADPDTESKSEEHSPFAERDDFRDLTSYEEAIVHGMCKPIYHPGGGYLWESNVYQGFDIDQILPPRPPLEGLPSTALPARRIPDRRMAATDRRRARNRVGRKTRRSNRIRAGK